MFECLRAVDDPSGVNLHDGWTGSRSQSVGNFSHGCWVTRAAFVAEILRCVEEQGVSGMGRVVSAHLFDLAEDPEVALFLAAVGAI